MIMKVGHPYRVAHCGRAEGSPIRDFPTLTNERIGYALLSPGFCFNVIFPKYSFLAVV